MRAVWSMIFCVITLCTSMLIGATPKVMAADDTDVIVRIVWEDENANDRPESVKVELWANVEVFGEMSMVGTTGIEAAVNLSEGNDWTYRWSSLPLNLWGFDVYDYSVKVSQGSEYVDGYRGPVVTKVNENEYEITYTHQEGYLPPKMNVSVKIEWDDVDVIGRYLQRRPESMAVMLYRGTAYTPDFDPASGQTELVNEELVSSYVSLTARNGWSYTWIDLPRYFYDNGVQTEYVYTVREVLPLGSNYSVDLERDGGNLTLINRACDLCSVTLQKNWADDNDKDGLRPASILVDLYWCDENNTEWQLAKQLEITAADHWRLVVDKVPYYPGVQYKIEEQTPGGYTSAIFQSGTFADGDYTYLITNTRASASGTTPAPDSSSGSGSSSDAGSSSAPDSASGLESALQTNSAPSAPKTGDDGSAVPWMLCLAVFAIGFALTICRHNKYFEVQR